MKKLVVLGAGFSAPAGIPVMRGFFGRLQEVVNDPYSGLGGHSDSREAIRVDDRRMARGVLEGWRSWKERTSGACDDLEAFCQSLDPASDLRWNTIYVIGRTFQLTMERGPCRPSHEMWDPFYRRFARDLACVENVTVVSFNYDILLDQALLQVGVRPDYRLDSDGVIDDEDAAKPSLPCPSVPLLKPHGSLNWLVCRDAGCKTISVRTPSTPDGLPQNWPTGAQRDHLDRHRLQADDYLRFLMLPPTTTKAERDSYETERALLRTVDEAVTASLAEAEEVYFLGYSIPQTDAGIVGRLRSGLQRCRQAFIVNRATAADDVRDLMDRYRAVAWDRFPITFFLGEQIGNVLRYRDPGCAWRESLLGRCPSTQPKGAER